MSGQTDKKRSKLKATVAIIVIFAVAVAVIFLISEEQFGEISTVYDDQRSTLWPLLIVADFMSCHQTALMSCL